MLVKVGRKWFIFHAVIPGLYPFWWKPCWLSCSTFIFSMLESHSFKNKLVTKMWRLKRWWYLSKLFTIIITSFNFFKWAVKLWRNLRLKFRSKLNHGFINHGYFHSAVLNGLYNFKIKRAQEARHVQNNKISHLTNLNMKNYVGNMSCSLFLL